jgi:hypothetical protein
MKHREVLEVRIGVSCLQASENAAQQSVCYGGYAERRSQK